VQLRHALERDRAAGVDFDEAWERAREAIRFPHRTEPRDQWKAALDATRDEWRAAWHGEPTAFATVAEALLAATDDSRPAARVVGDAHAALVPL
jgi:hypothetical protein